MWMLPLYLHVNQKSDYDMMIWYDARIFHLYQANRSLKVGQNQRPLGKNHRTIHKQNLAFPHGTEQGLNHSGEKPNGLRVSYTLLLYRAMQDWYLQLSESAGLAGWSGVHPTIYKLSSFYPLSGKAFENVMRKKSLHTFHQINISVSMPGHLVSPQV